MRDNKGVDQPRKTALCLPRYRVIFYEMSCSILHGKETQCEYEKCEYVEGFQELTANIVDGIRKHYAAHALIKYIE